MQDKTVSELINELKALRLRETQIIASLERASERETTERETHHAYSRGDRIKINNKIKKPVNWGDDPWDYRQARVATITQVTVDRVYFVTDNGVNTWRAPKNIQKL
jgi:hypothetical protein